MSKTTEARGMGRQARKRARTREALLKAASELFQSQGVEPTTIAQISERADVGYGSLYNHFAGLEEIVSLLSVESIQRILDATESIMSQVSDARLLPCVGARVILRMFLRDRVVEWMLDRPYVFTETFRDVARPFMLRAESPAVKTGTLNPAGGHDMWIDVLPWILLCELKRATGDTHEHSLQHEESFACVCMRLLGIDDADVGDLLAQSLTLVDDQGI